MVIKSTPEERNKYKDDEGNVMTGATIPEVLGKPVTILAMRYFTWGKFDGLAVKVRGPNGKLAIVEITAKFLIKKLYSPNFPKLPIFGRFIEKKSENGHPYFVFVYELDDRPDEKQEPETELLEF